MSLKNIIHQDEFLRNTIINLIQNKEEDLEKISVQILKTVLETLLQIERNHFMNSNELNNKKNGYYLRLAKTLSGVFEIKVPRDRLGLFKPLILEVAKKEKQNLDQLAFELYSKGMSDRDINNVLEKVYGLNSSPQYVSNITKKYLEVRKRWQEKKLDKQYIAVYIDATHMNIRRSNSVDNEAIYIVLGIKEDLRREVLGIYSIPEESAYGWKEVLSDLKQRGMEKTMLFISDNLKGIDNAILEIYPRSKIQKCIVHFKRNVWHKVKIKDRKGIMDDLKKVFDLDDKSDNKEKALKRMNQFLLKWKKAYPSLARMNISENHFTYLDFPFELRRIIYTTNMIERLNKEVKKVVKNKNSFPNPESALSLIWMKIMDVEERVYKYPIIKLYPIKDKLQEMIKDY